MISPATATVFALTSLALIVIPGPSVLFVIGRALSLGRRGGLLSVLGNELGVVPLVVAVAFGVGAVISASVVLFTVLKIVGAAYLAYLGVQTVRHRNDHAAVARPEPAARSDLQLLLQGFVVGVTNPKSIVFLVAVLPQFVDPSLGSESAQLLELGLIFVLVALASDSIWALVAGTARGWFATSPKRLSRMTATGGVLMIGLGGVLLATGHKR